MEAWREDDSSDDREIEPDAGWAEEYDVEWFLLGAWRGAGFEVRSFLGFSLTGPLTLDEAKQLARACRGAPCRVVQITRRVVPEANGES